MPAYDTLSQAVNDLQRRGYTDDLQLGGHCVVCGVKGRSLDPAEFHIDEFHRFEGDTNPEDQSIVYAISSELHDVKGLLISAYGMDASAMTQEMVRKLATH
ncbi:MAG: phosphoribosylpyrophosphate synthetase [Flavobacteriales bacterium]|nr:phosphoribosylpyrophosphate synthetase [Flavobacteriales bacterium]